jgi:uncharacterized protein (DUF433 family)
MMKSNQSMNDIRDYYEEGERDFLYNCVKLKGKDVEVREVLRQLSLGTSPEEIVNSIPGMTISDIYSCLQYGYELVGAIEFNVAAEAINKVIAKRRSIIDRLNSLRSNPDALKKYFK